MATLIIEDDKTARRIYKTASPELKEIMKGSYPNGFFSDNPMDFVTSFEAACDYNNTNHNDAKFTQGTEAGNNMEMLAEIAKAMNGGKVMKPVEKRYYPVFIHDESGFRFDGVRCDFTVSYTAGGPRLCCEKEEHAKYMGTRFLNHYDKFFNPKS